MLSTRFLIVSLLSFVLTSCSVNKQNDEWVSLHDNLYQSKVTGDLAIQVGSMTANGTEDRYIDHLGGADDGTAPKLKDVVDKWTFRQLSTGFYKDKNNVYFHRWMSDGGYFYKIEADAPSFHMVGACFAKDKDHIYSDIPNLETQQFDYNTFKTCFGCGTIAKDKNGIYAWGSNTKLNLDDPKDKKRYEEDKEIYDYLEGL